MMTSKEKRQLLLRAYLLGFKVGYGKYDEHAAWVRKSLQELLELAQEAGKKEKDEKAKKEIEEKIKETRLELPIAMPTIEDKPSMVDEPDLIKDPDVIKFPEIITSRKTKK